MNKNFMDMMQNQSEASSDEEKPRPGKARPVVTKKKARETDQNLREGYGVGNYKESTQRGGYRSRNEYRNPRGREKDRQSGTGRQAFGGGSKRGGYGKGNVGTMQDQIEEARRGDRTLKGDEEQKPEPVKEEKIVDVDDYMREKGLHLDMKGRELEAELEDPKMFEDETTVAVSAKKKSLPEKRKKRANEAVVMGDTIMTDKWKPQRRKKKKAKKPKLTEDDFPSLG